MKSSDTQMELVRRYLGGEATLEETRRLESMLAVDAQLRRDYLAYARVEAGLSSKVRPKLVKTASPARWLSWRPLAAAAALVLFVGGWVIGSSTRKAATLSEKPEAVDDGVALLTQVVDANWKGTHQPRAGSILSAGRLQLTSGLAQLEFYSGARVILEGPVDLELVSANRAVCHSGRIRAWVPPQARGFQVVSPEFELVDLGTEFGMEVGGMRGRRWRFSMVKWRCIRQVRVRRHLLRCACLKARGLRGRAPGKGRIFAPMRAASRPSTMCAAAPTSGQRSDMPRGSSGTAPSRTIRAWRCAMTLKSWMRG